MSPSDLGVEVPSGVEKIYAKVLYIAGGGGGSSSGGSTGIPSDVLRQDSSNPYLKRSAINSLITESTSSFVSVDAVSGMLDQKTSSFITSDAVSNLVTSQTSSFITSDAASNLIASQISSFITSGAVSNLINESTASFITEEAADEKINALSANYATKSDLVQLEQTLNVSGQIADITERLTKLEAYLGLPSEPQENPETLQDIITSLKNRVLQLEAANGTTEMSDRLANDSHNDIIMSDRDDESTTLIYGDRT